MCSSLLVLGGIHMQQSSMCLFHAYYVPHFPVHSEAIQYFLTLLSTPRGPPARKSSHCPYRFAFPCTVVVVVVVVVVVRLFRFHHHFSWKHHFFYQYRILLRADRHYRIHLLAWFCTVRDHYVRFGTDVVPYEIITYVLKRSSLCARFTVRPSTSVTYRTR
jgi:hypothetical protein